MERDQSGTPKLYHHDGWKRLRRQVETVIVSTRSKMAYQSTAGDPTNSNNTYDAANILRTVAEALGLNTSGLGGAATRLPMADYFH